MTTAAGISGDGSGSTGQNGSSGISGDSGSKQTTSSELKTSILSDIRRRQHGGLHRAFRYDDGRRHQRGWLRIHWTEWQLRHQRRLRQQADHQLRAEDLDPQRHTRLGARPRQSPRLRTPAAR
ncbi:hypothetical protein [Pseudomonas aeruginosa]